MEGRHDRVAEAGEVIVPGDSKGTGGGWVGKGVEGHLLASGEPSVGGVEMSSL